ncbi:MAG TPA: hypothetical protein VLC93_15940, partial [Myxococcota bacterium]|nr:hypothetical protein [Myxococcota bacterium]
MVTLLRLRAAIWLLAVVLGGLISACGAEGMNDDDDDDGDDDPVTYSIGGTVAGLSGTLVLRNNGGNDLSLTANTAFTFTTELANGATYAVTIATEPADQDCVVAHGSGSVSGADVGNVTVTCTDEALPDTPAIVRVTTSVDATVHGSALLFVVAGGDDLTYAWRSVGNDAVLNEGAEPFFLITDLTASDDGNCYTVTASNAGGEAVSDAMCLNVGDVSYDFNEDGGAIES